MNRLIRYYGIIWALSSMGAVAFWLHLQNSWQTLRWFQYSSWVAFFYLLYNSRSLRSRQSSFLLSGIMLLVVGQAFKVMHWPFAFELQLGSALSVSIGYTLFVVRRTRRRLVDLLKLSFVLISAITFVVLLLKLPYFQPLEKLSFGSFWLVYAYICILEAGGLDQSREEEVQEQQQPGDIL
jgi:hypothetical protein